MCFIKTRGSKVLVAIDYLNTIIDRLKYEDIIYHMFC